MSLTIKNTPYYWYGNYIELPLELLQAYIDDIEELIKISKQNFNENKKEIQIDSDCEEYPPEFVLFHKGINSRSTDPQEIFEEYFPNLQRQSALITLYSFLEHELYRLCFLFKETNTLNDVIEENIAGSIKYLKKVNALNGLEWKAVNDIRKIRNIIVHNSGKLFIVGEVSKKKEDRIKEGIKIIKNTKLLCGETEIKIEEGFLSFVLKTFKTQFEIIDKQIKSNYAER